ncbi:tRNA pseudouridine(13) synthase TruD [Streptomyces sp. WZ.A104]|uniref:tRNA pseudouridine(13) synthase TruD n=1 Tax=Streptomyces sp. WZ.A104 TaxID=2023771 RepID=UPI000BBC890A|nr:tRNA pseudouridine(13) synthase TruD [Streptomyces sp. WZ.A104]PCG84225.1 tRNA pseudouridine(13) synthase TruD [Streptomyces sp. WZ.A104]
MAELEPVVKHLPTDFLVRESLVVRLGEPATASWRYLMLRKCGYTTMEASRLVAAALGLSSREVTYGGLKDEDAVTEQLIGIPANTDVPSLTEEGWTVAAEADRWLTLHPYGHGPEPLGVGDLEGNAFRLIVRNLDAATAGQLTSRRKLTALVLNYYDIQRFGVPGGPRRTHLVGAAMLDGRWDEALRELAGLGAPESPAAERWEGPAAEFFTGLDPRTSAFYLAAHSSHLWNAELASAVEHVCGAATVPVRVEGVPFSYAPSPEDAARVLGQNVMLPYTKYEFTADGPVTHASRRATVVQTSVLVSGPEPDEEFPGRLRAELRFFLPSGSYATAAIRQILGYLGVPPGERTRQAVAARPAS